MYIPHADRRFNHVNLQRSQRLLKAACGFLNHRSAPEYQEYDKSYQKEDEQYLGDAGCGTGDSGKSQQSGDDGNDEKYDGPS